MLLRLVKRSRGKVLKILEQNLKLERRTVQRVSNKEQPVVRKRMVVKKVNRKKKLAWCLQKWCLTVHQYQRNIIFSDELQVVQVKITVSAHEAYRLECMFSECKPKVSVMNWGCITLCKVNGNINAEKYILILDEQLWPVIARHFPDNSSTFQDENAPMHQTCIAEGFTHINSCLHHITKYHRNVNLFLIVLKTVSYHAYLIDVCHFSAIALGRTLYL